MGNILKKKDGRGGYRPGSGRKPSDEPRITYWVRVTLETKRKVDALKREGLDVSRLFDDYVNDLWLETGMADE